MDNPKARSQGGDEVNLYSYSYSCKFDNPCQNLLGLILIIKLISSLAKSKWFKH